MERFFYHGPLAKDIRESRKTPWSGWLRTEGMKKDTMEWLVKNSMERRKTPPRQSGMKKDIKEWLAKDRIERGKTPPGQME